MGALDESIGEVNFVLEVLALVLERVVLVFTLLSLALPVILQFKRSLLSISDGSFSKVSSDYDYSEKESSWRG